MTWVKICGMTNLEDALVAVDAGADAVGFVFYEKSPRCIGVETAREIVAKLPDGVEKVGVFVGTELEVMAESCRKVGLTVAQIYPRTPIALNDQFMRKLGCRLMPALSTKVDEHAMPGFHVPDEILDKVVAVLVDSGNSERPGGTGQKSDWEALPRLMEGIGLNLVVAGGLTPQNVAEAMRVLQPWGVDVASGVEARQGKKDPEKVRTFVRAVREYDRKVS